MIDRLENHPISARAVMIQPRLVSDAHGCLLERTDGSLPERMDRHLEDRELNYIKKLVDERNLKGLMDLTALISRKKPGDVDYQIEHRTPGLIINNPDQKARNRLIHRRAYIDSYHVPLMNKMSCFALEGFDISAKGGRFTIATGTPQCCAPDFKKMLQAEQVWGILDSNLSVFFNPYREKLEAWPFGAIYSAVSKSAAVGICAIFDGVKPWVVEDNRQMARYQALINGVRVYIPGQEDKVSVEKIGDSGGEIVYGRSYQGIISDYLVYLRNGLLSRN